MPEEQPPTSIEPEAIAEISYWKNQAYHLKEPAVILMVIAVAIGSWWLSGWHYAGVIETKKAELDLLKTKLDASVANANQTMEEVKKLGLVLAAPMLDELAVDKIVVGGAKSLEEDVAHMQNIVTCLERLGASPDQINAIRQDMDRSVMRNLRARVTARLQAANKNKAPLFEHLSDMHEWNKEQFERFIQDNNLKVPSEVTDNLLKLDHYTTNKKLPKD